MHSGMPESQEQSAATTLDQIRVGGASLISFATARLEEARIALAEGRFKDAVNRLGEATGRIKPLADAEHFIAGWSDSSFIVRAKEAEVGMFVRGYGKIEAIEREPIYVLGEDGPAHYHVHIRFEGQEEPMESLEDEEELVIVP